MWSDSGTFGHEPSDHWTLQGAHTMAFEAMVSGGLNTGNV